MGTRYFVGDVTTGRRIVNLPVLSGTWEDDIDVAEQVSATVDLNDPVIQALNLRNSATVLKTFLAAVDTGAMGQDGKLLGAGPIWSTSYDRAAQTLQLTAAGIQSIFDHRFVLPATARLAPVTSWTIPDPTDPSGVGTIPNPALATTYTNLSLGSIAVSLVTQALSWPYGTLPIVLPSIVAGTSTRTYQGADFKTVGSALTDLINVIGGPEIDFTPRFTSDGLGVEWVMTTGTDADPLLYSKNGSGGPQITNWNVTAKESPVKSLTIDLDGSGIATLSWAVGGRQSDVALIARSEDDDLVASGYPFTEIMDSTHSDVVVQATLDKYAQGNLIAATSAEETWTFTVKAHPLDEDGIIAGPQLDNYDVGDFINLHIDAYDPATDKGDLYMPEGGEMPLRIVGLSGDQDGIDVVIKCAPVVG